MEAAREAGVMQLIDVDTVAILDWSYTMTEHSPIAPIRPGDSPYVAAKRAAYYEGMHRAARGQPIVFVTPGAIFGPGPFTERVLHATSFTGTLALALGGRLPEYLKFPLLWAYVDDVVAVCLAALERGESGARYLACGRAEDACSVAMWCNHAIAMTSVMHRVLDVEPHAVTTSMGSMTEFASRRYASPMADSSATEAVTGVQPRALHDGLHLTVAWLQQAADGR
jgi:nucleoside-diphosphate-sugar epimerase